MRRPIPPATPDAPPSPAERRRSRPVLAVLAAAALLAAAGSSAAPAGAAGPCETCPTGNRAVVASAKAPAAPAAAAEDPLVELARTKKRVVIADFGMGMCKQCKKQGEILEEVKKAFGEKVEVRFVHVGKEAALAERYEVSMIPHLVYLDPSGKVRQADTGVSSFEKIAERLAKLGVRR